MHPACTGPSGVEINSFNCWTVTGSTDHCMRCCKEAKRKWLRSIYRAGLSGDRVEEEEAAIDHLAGQTRNTRSEGPESILGTVLSPISRTVPKDGGAAGGDGGGGGDCGVVAGRLSLTDLEDRHEDARPHRQDPAGDPKDEEDDMKLLKWSEHLDLDRYMCEWRQMATSGPSEPWRNADDLAAAVLAVTVENQTMEQHHERKVPKSPAGRGRSTPSGLQGLRALTFSPLPPQPADGRHKPMNNVSWDYDHAGDGDSRSLHKGGGFVRDACDRNGDEVKDDGWSPPRGEVPEEGERHPAIWEKPSSFLYESTTFDLGSGDCSGQKWTEEE